MISEKLKKKFEEDINMHALLLHKVCSLYAFNAADRQDLFQEIVIQLWQAYPRFKGESKFSTWLYRIAINTSITGLRKNKVMVIAYDPLSLPTDIVDESTDRRTEENTQRLYTAIERLNSIERAIIMLYMEGRTYEEMEDVLGIESGTLRVKMNRIKDKLKNLTK